MIPGFKARLREEISYFLGQIPGVEEEGKKGEEPEPMTNAIQEIAEIGDLGDKIKLSDSIFPPNCLEWMGASLLSSLNNEIDRFLFTSKEYLIRK